MGQNDASIDRLLIPLSDEALQEARRLLDEVLATSAAISDDDEQYRGTLMKDQMFAEQALRGLAGMPSGHGWEPPQGFADRSAAVRSMRMLFHALDSRGSRQHSGSPTLRRAVHVLSMGERADRFGADSDMLERMLLGLAYDFRTLQKELKHALLEHDPHREIETKRSRRQR